MEAAAWHPPGPALAPELHRTGRDPAEEGHGGQHKGWWLWPVSLPTHRHCDWKLSCWTKPRAHKQALGAQTEHPTLPPHPLPCLPSGLLASCSAVQMVS